MSVGAYPSYRDSGIEWIGRVPSHWQIAPLKRAISFTTGWTPPTGRDDLYEGANPWVTIGDMAGKWIGETAKVISDEAIRIAGISASPKNSLLFSFKLSVGQVAFADRDLYTNEAIATFLPAPGIDLSYAYFAFPLLVTANAAENIYGAKLLNQELIKNAMLLLPPAAEQAAIAAFLDRETGKIDALVAEQERLMALLKEKRQAVISQAVTKGLNPNAKMRPSGVEWLGEVPDSWRVTRLKFIVRGDGTGIQIGPFGAMLTDLPTEPTGFKLYGQQNIISGDFSAGSRWITGETFKSGPQYAVRPGDLLVTRKGSLGNCRIIPADITPGWFDSDSICLRADPMKITSDFLQLLLHDVD